MKEFTDIQSTETSIQYLSSHDWDVERAINTALTSNSDPLTPTESSFPSEPEISPNPATSVPARYFPSLALYV